jgi:hypothetical protein
MNTVLLLLTVAHLLCETCTANACLTVSEGKMESKVGFDP